MGIIDSRATNATEREDKWHQCMPCMSTLTETCHGLVWTPWDNEGRKDASTAPGAYLGQLGEPVAHGPLRKLAGVSHQRSDVAVQLQPAQLAEALGRQDGVHACRFICCNIASTDICVKNQVITALKGGEAGGSQPARSMRRRTTGQQDIQSSMQASPHGMDTSTTAEAKAPATTLKIPKPGYGAHAWRRL